MGWAHCGTDSQGRQIGYAIEAECDESGCHQKIDRGLSYSCGGMHGDGGLRGDWGCEGYFCPEHLFFGEQDSLCQQCLKEEDQPE